MNNSATPDVLVQLSESKSNIEVLVIMPYIFTIVVSISSFLGKHLNHSFIIREYIYKKLLRLLPVPAWSIPTITVKKL